MKPPESFIGQPIRSLQTMLRIIAEHDPRHLSIIPDGIYGRETVMAVSAFQKTHGLPVTGIADIQTWEAITDLYEDALIHQQEAYPLQIVLNPGEVIHSNEKHPHLLLVQAMLTVLANEYESIGLPSFTGILDPETADALASFQTIAGLPATGNLDKHTWKHLVLHYSLAANHYLAENS